MKKFIVITLAFVIVALILKNVEVFAAIIKFTSEQFGKSFNAVTNVGDFK
jgi:hypothetical protein